MPLRPDRTWEFVSDAQAELIANLVNARFAADAPERELWRERFFAIRSNAGVDTVITELRAIPTLSQRAQAEREAKMPTEEGLYLNKATGTLYRLSKSSTWDMIVSIYSKTAARRLTLDNEVVEKGTWKRRSAFDSRMLLNRGTVTKDMLMTDEEKIEYRTGICNFCYRGLKAAESVARNYGKDCADKHSLPYGGLAEQLAAQVATTS